jgi:hypothetical protein
VTTTPVPAPSAGTSIRYATRPDSTRFTKVRLVSLDAERLAFERYQMDPAGLQGVWTRDTVATPSLASVQVPVGRRGNAGRGALIGTAVGVALGIACLSDDSEWVSGESCFVGYTLFGAGTGALIGMLVRSDVWAPAVLPSRRPEPRVTLLR